MALTASERMARMRSRQRKAGLVPLSIVVPAGDAVPFTRLAARRRRLARNARDAGIHPCARLSFPRGATTSISPGDILAFRDLLESTAVSLVVRRMSPSMQRRLHAALRREAALPADAASIEFQRLHLLLGELSGDEPLQLLLRIALQLTDERSAFERSRGADRREIVARVRRLHAGIVGAIIAGDEALAVRRMKRYLGGLREWLV
jgi:DNA-binding FadR family transcriptional regulator